MVIATGMVEGAHMMGDGNLWDFLPFRVQPLNGRLRQHLQS
jgi:hypothetical protein